jgi:FkbM family methyltransferase
VRAWFGAANKLPRPWDAYARAAGLRALRPSEVVVETQFGRFVNDPSDHTFFTAYVDEPLETAIVWRLLQPGDVAVDVGANRGWYTLLCSHRVGPAGRVLAFEPDQGARTLLERNLAANPNAGNVMVFDTALSNEHAHAEFVASRSSAKSHLLGALEASAASAAPVVRVESERLADVLDRERVERIDLVKIDVEGAECLVLQGLRPAIEAGARPCLLVETIARNLARYESSPADVVAAVGPAYAPHWVCWEHGVLEPFTDAASHAGRNMLSVPRDRLDTVMSSLFGAHG